MAKKNTITLPDGTVVSHKKPLKEQMYKYRWFYLMFLPVFIFVVVFYYLPMFGIVYSFTEYKLIKDPGQDSKTLRHCFQSQCSGVHLKIRCF